MKSKSDLGTVCKCSSPQKNGLENRSVVRLSIQGRQHGRLEDTTDLCEDVFPDRYICEQEQLTTVE